MSPNLEAPMTEIPDDETALVARLRQRDERAFAVIVDGYSPAMLRVARSYVRSHELAEDVVQETWIGVIKGLNGFQGRSSLRTWIFTVLINTAKKRGGREHREQQAQLRMREDVTVDPRRFNPVGDQWPGHWRDGAQPQPFPATPEDSALHRELLTVARNELDRVPERQRVVVTLRDIAGMESEEVCELLAITAANQRVLLHRGRAAIRQALENYLTGTP